MAFQVAATLDCPEGLFCHCCHILVEAFHHKAFCEEQEKRIEAMQLVYGAFSSFLMYDANTTKEVSRPPAISLLQALCQQLFKAQACDLPSLSQDFHLDMAPQALLHEARGLTTPCPVVMGPPNILSTRTLQPAVTAGGDHHGSLASRSPSYLRLL